MRYSAYGNRLRLNISWHAVKILSERCDSPLYINTVKELHVDNDDPKTFMAPLRVGRAVVLYRIEVQSFVLFCLI